MILHRPSKNGKTAQMRAVQGVVSTVQEAYIDVRDQTARNDNDEMRSISVVLRQSDNRSVGKKVNLFRRGMRAKAGH